MSKQPDENALNLITAKEAAELLQISRAGVERLQIKGILIPVPTIYSMYYFEKSQVIEYKETQKQSI